MSDCKTYVGTKFVNAWPMNRADYNELQGWKLPADENGADEGYLIEYLDGGKANHPDYAGYISWSPKDVFDKAYKPLAKIDYDTGLYCVDLGGKHVVDFGIALIALQLGHKVARTGWNGKGMYLYYVPPAKYPAKHNTNNTMVGVFEDDMVPYRDYIAMKTAQNDVVPWVASQSDILTTDWVIVK